MQCRMRPSFPCFMSILRSTQHGWLIIQTPHPTICSFTFCSDCTEELIIFLCLFRTCRYCMLSKFWSMMFVILFCSVLFLFKVRCVFTYSKLNVFFFFFFVCLCCILFYSFSILHFPLVGWFNIMTVQILLPIVEYQGIHNFIIDL